jgi:hypothetical protein
MQIETNGGTLPFDEPSDALPLVRNGTHSGKSAVIKTFNNGSLSMTTNQ